MQCKNYEYADSLIVCMCVYVCMCRFMKRSVGTVLHYDDWKDRRKIFDQAFTKKLVYMYVRYALGNSYIYHSATFVVWFQYSTM